MSAGKDNLILICGDEEYLKERKRAELFEKYRCGASMNFNSFSDDNADFSEISSLIGTLPFFEDRRIVYLKNTSCLKGAADESLLSALAEIPDSTVVIIQEKEADVKNKIYKLIRKNGEIFRFDRAENKRGQARQESRSEVLGWIRGVLKSSDRRMDSRDIAYLAECSGYDMQRLSTELEKLICYALDKPPAYIISRADIDQICSKTLSDRIFDMTDLKFQGKTAGAVSLLEELFAIRSSAMGILYLLSRQFNQALAFKECQSKGMKDAEIAREMGIEPWLVSKLKKQTSGVSSSKLISELENCAGAEYKIKTGDLPERLALELLMLS